LLKKVLIVLVSLIGMAVIGGGVYAYNVYDSIQETAQKMYEPVEDSGESSTDDKPKQPGDENEEEGLKPISILLMGVDEREDDRGRSDALIVLTLNPEDETLQMVSIPRDTRTSVTVPLIRSIIPMRLAAQKWRRIRWRTF
jgi:anionic cell wall polymer biosynthesis LytR-Cps2A-Psr (LCP) family protein